MVINDKALLALMKDAYKGGGYTVAVDQNRHTIITHAWAVEIDSDNMPRDVIGLLAVHMGYLPEVDSAYKITKTKEGPNVQSMIYEEAIKPIEAMDDNTVAVGVTKTAITLDGDNVWQQNIGLSVRLVDPELEALIRKKDEVKLIGNTFRVWGEISRAWVALKVNDPEDTKIRCLSGIRWTA